MHSKVYTIALALGLQGAWTSGSIAQETAQPKAEAKQVKMEERRAKLRQVKGDIVKIKQVKAKGAGPANQMVMIKTDKGNQRLLIDLGPVEKLGDLKLEIGSAISAQGPVIVAGDRTVMVAQRLKSQDKTVEIERQVPKDHQAKQQDKTEG